MVYKFQLFVFVLDEVLHVKLKYLSKAMFNQMTIRDRCVYNDCTNTRENSECRFFRFPGPRDPRQHIWIKNSGNNCLKLWSAATVQNAVLCQNHFASYYFTDESRHQLRCYAVPVCYKSKSDKSNLSDSVTVKVLQNLMFQNPCGKIEEHSGLPTPESDTNTSIPIEVASRENTRKSIITDGMKKRNTLLNISLQRLRIKYEENHLKMENQKLRKRKYVGQRINAILEKTHLRPSAKAAIRLQLLEWKSPYTKEEKDLAKQLLFHSVSALMLLRKRGCNFPSESAIWQWITEYDKSNNM